MTGAPLDHRTALVVIDLQKGIVALPDAAAVSGVIGNCAALAEAFRGKGLPVVLVNVTSGAPGRTDQAPRMRELPAGFSDLIPELNQQPQDHRVTKRTWGAFMHTGLEDRLKSLGVTQVVVAGVATSIGVESTARQAYELGFNVTLPVDAMTDLNADAHHNSIVRIFPRLGEVGTTAEVLALLAEV